MWKCKARFAAPNEGARNERMCRASDAPPAVPLRRRAVALAVSAALAAAAPPVSANARVQEAVSPPVQDAAGWRVALHYGAHAPLSDLHAFDRVVVEPGHGHDPTAYAAATGRRSVLLAYLSVGEVRASDAPQLPAAMLAGENRAWGSRIVDPAHPEWPRTFIERFVAPLWARGFRGFFLDTLDAYHALPGDDALRERRRQGLIRAIRLIRERFPQASLIANRGFELLPAVHPLLEAVAAESLYGRWDQAGRRYLNVPEEDRTWLLARFAEARALGLHTLAIDYAPPDDSGRRREIAQRILAHGITPYVTSGALDTVGTGPIEVSARTVLLVHDDAGGNEFSSPAQRLLAMPLQYLGLRVELVNARTDAARLAKTGDYAAVVALLNGPLDRTARDYWVQGLREAKRLDRPIVFFNHFGLPAGSAADGLLDVRAHRRPPQGRLRVVSSHPVHTGQETPVLPMAPSVAVNAPPDSESWVRLADVRGTSIDAVAITPWGGFALAPHAIQARDGGENWVVDPIAFLARALERVRPPVSPDPTTENGRRLLLVHVDGDGFASRAELPGAPLAAQVMLDEFIARYPVPHTVSVIEGEVGPQGLYPELSPRLEAVARRIFALDHVEIATHSYSHPFFWRAVVDTAGGRDTTRIRAGKAASYGLYGLHLPIDGYEFDLERDIAGSADYIDRRLAPPGKKTGVMLWTGDCDPPGSAIATAEAAGLLNMNGGDTAITRFSPTLTKVAAMSVRKNGRLQVLAPNQNENVYTNDWTGPFYGYERVIETFELTEKPRRLKPINIYYHTYSASKRASIAALHRVYRYALDQPVNPVPASDYIRKVGDFEDMAVSRRLTATAAATDPTPPTVWEIRGMDDLRTLRVAPDILRRIDWRGSSGVAGYAPGADGAYLHLGGGPVALHLHDQPSPVPRMPLLAFATGRIDALQRDERSLRFRLSGHDAVSFGLRLPARCEVRAGNRILAPRGRPMVDDANAPAVYEYGIRRDAARSGTLVSVHC